MRSKTARRKARKQRERRSLLVRQNVLTDEELGRKYWPTYRVENQEDSDG